MPSDAYQVIQLDRVNTLVDTRDDLLGDGSGIDVLRVEAVTKPRHTGSDLIELHAFFASVWEVPYQQVGIHEWQGQRATTCPTARA